MYEIQDNLTLDPDDSKRRNGQAMPNVRRARCQCDLL